MDRRSNTKQFGRLEEWMTGWINQDFKNNPAQKKS
jgi:hypothetical protein